MVTTMGSRPKQASRRKKPNVGPYGSARWCRIDLKWKTRLTARGKRFLEAELAKYDNEPMKMMKVAVGAPLYERAIRELKTGECVCVCGMAWLKAAIAFQPRRGHTLQALVGMTMQRDFWKRLFGNSHLNRKTGKRKYVKPHVRECVFPDQHRDSERPWAWGDAWDELVGGERDPVASLDAADESRVVLAAVENPRDRTMLVMRYVDGLSMKEIARAVGLDHKWVGVIIRDTISKTRERLQLCTK